MASSIKLPSASGYVSVDTNILLLDANNIFSFGDNDIVLSEVVLQEMDSKKSVPGELGYNSRLFARILGAATVIWMDDSYDSFHLTLMEADGHRIYVVSKGKYSEFEEGDSINDQKIIQTVGMFEKETGTKIQFYSNDTMCRLRALIDGVDAKELKYTDDGGYSFVKELEIEDPEVFRRLHKSPIEDVDPEYELQNYNYKFSYYGQMKIASIVNGLIVVIGKDTDNELCRQSISPINVEQKMMSRAIQDSAVDIVACEAGAGSGKTAMAISNAMRLMDTNKDKYHGIVYIRNTSDDLGDKSEEVGFLSGNDEKFNVYLGPINDTLDFIARKTVKTKGMKNDDIEVAVENKIDDLRQRYNIESTVALGMRGRTLHNCIVILDECQNMGANTMQKLISRVGKDCKLIVIGSNRQIDNPYLTKWNNGLSLLLDYCKHRSFEAEIGVFAINLTKIVRSPIAKFAENLYSSERIE